MPAELTCQEACTEALLHDEHEVCGLKLRPFCLEMWLMLGEAKSPLIGAGVITIADLQLAAVVCSTSSVAEYFAITRRPNWIWRLWWKLSRAYRRDEELAKFNRYIDDYCPAFPRWNFEEEGEPSKCPDVLLCAARLIDRGHPRHEVKREMGIGEILAWGLAIDEVNGRDLKSIQSEAEILAVRELEARAA